MKKIVLFLLIIFVLCIVSVFMFPNTTYGISQKLGMEKTHTLITSLKKKLDTTSVQDLQEAYSGAVDVKNKVVDGVKETKDTIDDIRVKAKQAEEVYQETKQFIDTTQETINTAKQIMGDVEKIGNDIKGLVNTGSIQQ